jgi:apolipoprotein N-acyltransferase
VADDGGAGLSLLALRHTPVSLAAAALVGALTAYLSFAPIGWWWFPFIGFAALAALIQNAASVKRGALIGFVFGLAYFLAGVAWVRISLNEFGGMPLPIAWFAAFLFCAFLSLYPMLACAFATWAKPKGAFFFAVVFASAWTFAEYLRAHVFTGFEWLAIGTSQTGGVWGLQSFIPVFGALGASWLIAGIGALIGTAALPTPITKSLTKSDASEPGLVLISLMGRGIEVGLYALVAVGVGMWALFNWSLSEPIGKPIKVSLLQGNIAQTLKWDPERFASTLVLYEKLITEAKGELIILPETALPSTLDRIDPAYIERLRSIAVAKKANLIIGVPVQEKDRYYNAAISLGVDPVQQYRKMHLVPFGEYMPLRGALAWFYANLTIPMSDFAKGDADQPPIKVSGQTLGISICYEDAFARDVHRTLPDATLIVNISNDAWFGKSAAAEQHLQLAQMRAIEFARPMLRANNTGITAVIDEKGRVAQRLESFSAGILETTIQGRKGYTPYMAWGDLPILLICLAGIGIGAARRGSRAKPEGVVAA